MRHRVECLHCKAHRDRALVWTIRCFICGCERYRDIPPNAIDLEAAAEELRRTADGPQA
jgi:hypothetical protein